MNDIQLEFSNLLKSKKFSCYNLTVREKEVINLISKGMRNRVIGDTLYISEATVKKHVYNIFNKLEISSRFELICILQGIDCRYRERAC